LKIKKISIVTVTYNCKHKLIKTLNSIVCKSSSIWVEHIFIDAVSTDGTLEVIDKYCSNSQYDTEILSEKDYGIYDALNKATEISSGDFILLLHSGDSLNLSLDEIIEDIETNQNFDFICFSGIFSKGNIKSNWSRHDYQLSIYNPALRHPCILIRRETLNYFNGYDLSYKISADYHLISRYFQDDNLIKKIAIVDKFLIEMEVFGFSDNISNFFLKKKEHLKIIRGAKFNSKKVKFYLRIFKQFISFIFKF
jgi:glycosyltransferase